MYGVNDHILNLKMKYYFLFRPERFWVLREVLYITSVYMYIKHVYVRSYSGCWISGSSLTERRILGLTKSVDGRTAIASVKV